MDPIKLTLKKLRILNTSERVLEVWLEWGSVDRYEVASGQAIFINALTRDSNIEESEWSVFVDSPNNAISIYIPGKLELAEDFYLTDCKTSDRIETTN